MKKLLIPITLFAIAYGLYEQSKEKSNIYILCFCIAVFMYGILRLSASIPSKNKENKEDDSAE